jgi:dynein heavy chain
VFNLRDFGRVVQGIMSMRKDQIEPKETGGGGGDGGSEEMEQHGGSESIKEVGGTKKMIRLWAHEVLRVFSDRLVGGVDREIMLDIVKRSAGAHLIGVSGGGDLQTCMAHHGGASSSSEEESSPSVPMKMDADFMDSLLFCDFLHPEMDPRPYDEVESLADLRESMQRQLDEYNLVSTKPMTLVLFN